MCSRPGRYLSLPLFTLFLLTLPFLKGCESSEPISVPSDELASFEIVDAADPDGNPEFFFLPPMVPNPSGATEFDAGAFEGGLSPTVEVWALPSSEESAAALTATFTMEGTGTTDPIVVYEADELYQVNWNLNEFVLDPALTYQIRVLLGDNMLGFADLDLVSSGREFKNVDTGEYIPLKDGRTLPIKFRLEEGVGSYVGFSGGTVSAEDGSWSVEVQPGTFETPVQITGTPTSPPEGALPGTTWAFGPEGTDFVPPATLTIWFDPDDLEDGKYPRLHKLVEDEWVPYEGAVVDFGEGFVSAPVDGFSHWTIIEGQLILTVDIQEGNGFVWIDGRACGRDETNPCELGYDIGETAIVEADTDTDDVRFEEWLGDVGDFVCPVDPKGCSFVMTEDRDIIARFSMPGSITVSATSAVFEMPYGGAATPASDAITVTHTGGRPVHLDLGTVAYSPAVTPWLEATLDVPQVEAGSSATLTLSIKTNSPPVGVNTATFSIHGGYDNEWRIEVTLTVTGTDVVVDGSGRHVGPLPVVPYAFVDAEVGGDAPVLENGLSYLFGLFDTGSTRVMVYSESPYTFSTDPDNGLTLGLPNRITDANWFDSDAGLLGMFTAGPVGVRLNSLGGIDATTLEGPFDAPGTETGAEIEVAEVTAEPRPGLDVTLLGAPVAQEVVAKIDYTQKVVREGFNFYPGLDDPANAGIPGFYTIDLVEGPDITFFQPGESEFLDVELHLALGRFGLPERWVLNGLEFKNEGVVVTDDPTHSPPKRFLYDTGTTPTIIGDEIAEQLGLLPGTGIFNCLGGAANGFTIDEISMVGMDGTYRVTNPSVCVSQAHTTPLLIAVIGSNLFDQVPIVFDGPGNTLGIGTPTSTPVSW